jgi:hypothetical protein
VWTDFDLSSFGKLGSTIMLHLEALLLGGFVESTKNLRNPAKKHLIGTHSEIPTI